MVIKEFDLEQFKLFMAQQSKQTRIYIGGDSERLVVNGVPYADYSTIVVVHIDGSKGCRVFGELVRERDYDNKISKPTNRLFMEAIKIAELYAVIQDVVQGFDVEIHLDLNGKKIHNSNLVVSQAVGYIQGSCQIQPKIKPEAFAASYGADHFKTILYYQKNKASAKSHGVNKPAKKRKGKKPKVA